MITLLAHGAGAGMDTDFMNGVAEGVSSHGVQVIRFEFPYMVKRPGGRSSSKPVCLCCNLHS